MTPLDLRILDGSEDARLLSHIGTLEGFEHISLGEQKTLEHAYMRLDQITDPVNPAPDGRANALMALMRNAKHEA